MQTTELDFNCLFNNFQPLPKYLSELFKCTPAKPIAALGLALSFKFICERVCLEFVIFTPISEAVLWVKLNFITNVRKIVIFCRPKTEPNHMCITSASHTHTVSVSRISILWIKWYVASGRESSEKQIERREKITYPKQQQSQSGSRSRSREKTVNKKTRQLALSSQINQQSMLMLNEWVAACDINCNIWTLNITDHLVGTCTA